MSWNLEAFERGLTSNKLHFWLILLVSGILWAMLTEPSCYKTVRGEDRTALLLGFESIF